MEIKKGLAAVVVGLVVLCLALGAVVVSARQGRGELLFVDGASAFVYPDGDVIVLVLDRGEFAVEGSAAQGCYELIPPSAGEIRGRAVWTADVCGDLAVLN